VSHRLSQQEMLRKECIEDPVLPGASCEARSMRAMQSTLHMWGDNILPKMEANLVDPKKTSPLYDRERNESSLLGTRVACEWTEIENLKCMMVRDSAIWMVEEQIRKAKEEAERWTTLKESIQAQEIELSSLVAIGDVILGGADPTTTSLLSPGGKAVGADSKMAGGNLGGGGVGTLSGSGGGNSPSNRHLLHHHHHPGIHTSSSSTSSSAASSPMEHRLSSRLHVRHQGGDDSDEYDQRGDNGRKEEPPVAAAVFDANLEEIQARYREEHEREDSELKDPLGLVATKATTTTTATSIDDETAVKGTLSSASKFHDPDSSRYLNPFFSDEDD